jgi:integrase/recombinase XerD
MGVYVPLLLPTHHTPIGLRNYAILLLLATYGLRAGEVVRLRLEDLDWRHGCLRVCQSKSGRTLVFPLLVPVGDAILAYLRDGRPTTEAREVFLRAQAPVQPFRRGSSLYAIVARRLPKAGIHPAGKRGPHTFRHAHAVRLLRAAVPPEGHRGSLGAHQHGLHGHLPQAGHRRPPRDRSQRPPRQGGAAMTAWLPDDDLLIRRYVQTLPLRSQSTQAAARSILRWFQQFVQVQAPHEPLSQETLEAWVRDGAGRGSLRHVIARTRRVDGFLTWLVAQGVLATHPWATLRHTYGGRMAPIVRALLAPNPPAALDALRPLPRCGSHLGPAMRQHLAHRQSLGFRYEREQARLLNFDRYLQTRPGAGQLPVHVLVREYAEQAPTPEARLERWQSGRTLAQSMQRHDPTVSLPPLDRLIVREAMCHRRPPYIYTVDEVQRLLQAAHTYLSPRVPLRPLTLSTMVLLAYCAGLRLGELLRLTVGDVDLAEATLTIRDTKFFKSRRLPLQPSVLEVLRTYLQARAQSHAAAESTATLFWNEHKGCGYHVVTMGHLLAEVIRRADLKPATGRAGPRFHDLRHTFVVHRMLAWYRAGINPQSRLHYLATDLGHKDVYSTLVYLTITQDLLQEANARFHTVGAHVLQPARGDHECHSPPLSPSSCIPSFTTG